MTDDQSNNKNPPDPTSSWPPRFNASFIRKAGWLLLGVAAVLSVAVWRIFDLSGLLGSATGSPKSNVLALVLLILGACLLVSGIFFLLVEARVPPPTTPVTTRYLISKEHGGEGDVRWYRLIDTTPLPKDAAGDITSGIAKAIDDKRASTVLLSLGTTFVILALLVSGTISISAGTPGATSTTTSTTTSSTPEGEPTPTTTATPGNGDSGSASSTAPPAPADGPD